MIKRILIFLAVSGSFLSVFSQKNIQGFISDRHSGEKLIGCSVYISGTTDGVTSNNYGFFSIKTNQLPVSLVFSYIGYTSDTVKFSSSNENANVLLSPKASNLQEVEIKAVGTSVAAPTTGVLKIPMQQIKLLPALGGEVDVLMGEIMKVQIRANELKLKNLVSDLQEVFDYIGGLSRAEVLNEPLNTNTILGFNHDEIREMSHNPKKHFNHEHLFNITYELGEIPILLNALRALIRKTEIACYEAFKLEDGTVKRVDLMQGYNRLSSIMYIIIFKVLDH